MSSLVMCDLASHDRPGHLQPRPDDRDRPQRQHRGSHPRLLLHHLLLLRPLGDRRSQPRRLNPDGREWCDVVGRQRCPNDLLRDAVTVGTAEPAVTAAIDEIAAEYAGTPVTRGRQSRGEWVLSCDDTRPYLGCGRGPLVVIMTVLTPVVIIGREPCPQLHPCLSLVSPTTWPGSSYRSGRARSAVERRAAERGPVSNRGARMEPRWIGAPRRPSPCMSGSRTSSMRCSPRASTAVSATTAAGADDPHTGRQATSYGDRHDHRPGSTGIPEAGAGADLRGGFITRRRPVSLPTDAECHRYLGRAWCGGSTGSRQHRRTRTNRPSPSGNARSALGGRLLAGTTLRLGLSLDNTLDRGLGDGSGGR